MLLCMYTHIIILRLYPSITEGQQKQFDPEAKEAVCLAMERKELELGDLREWQT